VTPAQKQAARTIDGLLSIADFALAVGDPRLAACAIRGAERLARENCLVVEVLIGLADEMMQHVQVSHPTRRGAN